MAIIYKINKCSAGSYAANQAGKPEGGFVISRRNGKHGHAKYLEGFDTWDEAAKNLERVKAKHG